MRAPLPATLALLVAPLVAEPASASPSPDHRTTSVAAAAPPSVTPAVPLRGERFTLYGRAPNRPHRFAQLQRRREGRWVTVARDLTSGAGRYQFVRRTMDARIALRVLVPAKGTAKAWASGVRIVHPATPTSTLGLSGDVETSTATVRVTPARTGRLVELQVRQGSVWKPVGQPVRQAADGSARFSLDHVPAQSREYRARVRAWNGAPGFDGSAVAFAPALLPRTLPKLNLTTPDGLPITSKETYVSGTMTLDGVTFAATEMRGRGNSTWLWPKKPYRLKLATSTGLLGMPADRDWVLLANYADRSKLRTATAFALAGATGLAWTPQSRFVDVTLNGTDLGLYQLTEHIEAKAAKVALPAGGMLLELEERFESEGTPGFRSPHGMPLTYKDPDSPSAEVQAEVQADVAALETALYGDGFADPATGYAAHVDVASFVDWYLVNELMKSFDAGFFASVYLTWDPATGKVTAGPVWDFDLSGGFAPSTPPGYADPAGWWLRGGPGPASHVHHGDHWLARMAEDPAFVTAVEQRWAALRPAIGAVVAGIAARAAEIRSSSVDDYALWQLTSPPYAGAWHAASTDAEVGYLTAWLTARLAWMDEQLGVS